MLPRGILGSCMMLVGICLVLPSRCLPRLVCTGRGLDEYEYDKSCSIAAVAQEEEMDTPKVAKAVQVEVADTPVQRSTVDLHI